MKLPVRQWVLGYGILRLPLGESFQFQSARDGSDLKTRQKEEKHLIVINIVSILTTICKHRIRKAALGLRGL